MNQHESTLETTEINSLTIFCQVLQAKGSLEAEFSSLLAAKQGMAEKVAEQLQRLEKPLVSDQIADFLINFNLECPKSSKIQEEHGKTVLFVDTLRVFGYKDGHVTEAEGGLGARKQKRSRGATGKIWGLHCGSLVESFFEGVGVALCRSSLGIPSLPRCGFSCHSAESSVLSRCGSGGGETAR